MPQVPTCCCEGMDSGHCWGCADGTWFGWSGISYDQALADCNSAESVGGPGVNPYNKPVIDKIPYGTKPDIYNPKRRVKVRQNMSNFTNNRNSNVTWSGSQSNVGPQDRVFAGNYFSGREGCDCDCR